MLSKVSELDNIPSARCSYLKRRSGTQSWAASAHGNEEVDPEEAKTIILRLERKWGSDKSHKSCPVKSHTELRVGWELIGKKLLIFCLFTLILHYWMYSYTSALGAISDGRRLAAEGQQDRRSRPGPDSVYSGEEDRAAVTLSSTTC